MAIRVLIVDDSPLFAEAIADVLTEDADIQVIGTATNGSDAVAATKRDPPDLIIMDLNMPIMGGLEAVEIIMATRPTPILLMTSAGRVDREKLGMEAIRRGALDLMLKPERYPGSETDRRDLREKVRLLSSVTVVRHSRRETASPSGRAAVARADVVGVVGSTGAPAALAAILAALPSHFRAPIVVVQHMVPGFVHSLVEWLDSVTPLAVEVACDGAELRAGRVYVAPDHRHLVVSSARRLRVMAGSPVGGSIPSGDRLLESLAECCGAAAAAVILSGMGTDGREGARAVRAAGGATLAQDESTAVVFGMPAAAWEAGVIDRLVPLEQIASILSDITGAADAESRRGVRR